MKSLETTSVVCDDNEFTTVDGKGKRKINHHNTENGQTNNCTKKAQPVNRNLFYLKIEM